MPLEQFRNSVGFPAARTYGCTDLKLTSLGLPVQLNWRPSDMSRLREAAAFGLSQSLLRGAYGDQQSIINSIDEVDQ